MLFLKDMPFHAGAVAAVTSPPASVKRGGGFLWLPITVKAPPDAKLKDRPCFPNKGNRPFPWLLDTGCGGSSLVAHPGALRCFSVERKTVYANSDGVQSPVVTADKNAPELPTFYSNIEVWLHSNLPAFAPFPIPLNLGPGLRFRDDLKGKDHDDAASPFVVHDTMFVLGMKALIQSRIVMTIDWDRRTFSLWLPYGVWLEQLGKTLSDKVRSKQWKRVSASLAEPCPVWEKGTAHRLLLPNSTT